MEIPKPILPKHKRPEKQREVMCSKCNVIGHYDIGEETVKDIDFLLMSMEKCGHRFAISAWDEKAKEKRDLTQKLSARMTSFITSGDSSGAGRTAKKYQAAQINYAQAMVRTWKVYGHLIDAIPTEALLGNEKPAINNHTKS